MTKDGARGLVGGGPRNDADRPRLTNALSAVLVERCHKTMRFGLLQVRAQRIRSFPHGLRPIRVWPTRVSTEIEY